jgi:calcineurin-like phosphoesterase family protein
MTIFFTSDTHFDDARRIRIDHRPFATIEEHDAGLIARWNEMVGPKDDVYHLGDVTAAKTAKRISELLATLKGRKHLIIGNNDPPTTIENKGWASVTPYLELMIDGKRIILCHYAFRTWHDMGKGAIDLHGHSHGKLKETTRQYDVGVDVFDYRPVTSATILASKRGKGAT